jgi:pimeloyl-ACP methyl ester carboxylesterase
VRTALAGAQAILATDRGARSICLQSHRRTEDARSLAPASTTDQEQDFQLIRAACIVTGIAAVLCAAPIDTGATQAQTVSLAGEWIGTLDLASQPGLLRITVGGTARDGWTATVILQPIAMLSPVNADTRRIADSWRNVRVAVNGTSWSVVAGAVPDSISVDVRTTGNASMAKVSFRNQTADVVLHHLATADRSLERQYAGAYLLPSGHRIYVWRPSNSGPAFAGVARSDGFLTYLEEATGRSGTLYPVARDAYVAGPTSVLPDPVRVRAAFRGDADGRRRLIWQETGHKEVMAIESQAYRREEVQVPGSAGALGCDVLTPARAGKHPAAVLVPGAGAQERHEVYLIAEVFAEHGVAALACDKRGTGTSEGDWRLTSFEQQAQDVAAGIRFLQQRTDIDPNRVGVWGFSEGAWVAPLTFIGNPRPAFLILAAVPATSRRESILTGNVDRLRGEGTQAAELKRFREFFERYQQAIIDNDAPAITQLYRQYSRASWLPANMPTAQSLNDASWQRARLTWPHEPKPVLSRITCPVLAMWGEEDQEFPSRIHRPLVEQSMRAARNPDYTLSVIPGADHSFRLTVPSFVEQIGYAPEYLPTVVEWLRGKVVK